MTGVSFGTLPQGGEVTQFTLTGPTGGQLTVLDYGAATTSYRTQADDPSTEVLVGFDDLAGHLDGMGTYCGAVVGRYANRIANATITVDGITHELAANEGTTVLHGGQDGFSHRVWEVADQTESSIDFTLTSPDGDQGFPGEVSARARYEVLDDGFALELSATTTAATPVCLTSHLFVNLAGGGSVEGHEITVPADRFTPIDESSIPISAPIPVDGTPFDLRQGARIGERVRDAHEQIGVAKGIDHSFEVSGTGLRTVAQVHEPTTGRRLELKADAPALQVYTGNFLEGVWVSRSGRLRQGDGLALEPGVHPDSPNQGWAADVILRPGQEYRTRMEWHIRG